MKLATTLTALFLASAAFATDTTMELLEAPWVRDQLRFQITQDGKMQAARDGSRTFVDVPDGAAYVMSEQRDLVFRDFNPMLQTIATTETTQADVNYGSLSKLLEAIKQMPANLALAEHKQKTANELLQDLLDNPPRLLAAASDHCTKYGELRLLLGKLHDALNVGIVDAATFKRWTETTTSAGGVAKVRGEMTERIGDLNKNLALLAEIDKKIFTDYTNAAADEPGSAIQASTFALVYEGARRMSDVAAKRRQLVSDLTTLNTSLKNYEDKTQWREDAPGDYIFYKPSPDFTNVKLLNISAKSRSFTIDGNALQITEGAAVVRTIRLRHYSLIVPELSAAVIHTDLSYPKYGTKQEGGQTVVAAAGRENLPLGGAVLLNFVCRCWPAGPVYPALQFGVTSAKQYPGFATGAGLRITRVASLSITVGKLITWFDDLDGLTVGQPISGTAELESHLKRKRAKSATYFGVQYNF